MPSEPALRTWQVTATILVPTWVATGPDGRFPTALNPQSRVPEDSARYADLVVTVRNHRHPDPQQWNPRWALMELVARVATASPESAIDALEIPIVSIIDLLSFQMAAAIGIEQVNVLDVTAPVEVGDERECHFFGGSPFGRYQRGIDMQAVRGQLLGQLPVTFDVGDDHDRAALRWLVKSLGTDVLHDQFLFLWIGLEILCDASGVRVDSTYTGPCQHEIPECPECGRPTTKMVRGATLRKYLGQFDIDDGDSAKLWKYRQMMHGAVRFEPGTGKDLGRLVQLLRAVVVAALKGRLGLGVEEPPLVSMSGLSIHPSLSLGGTRQISDEDLGLVSD